MGRAAGRIRQNNRRAGAEVLVPAAQGPTALEGAKKSTIVMPLVVANLIKLMA
jgi:hypothetical protein